MRRLPLADPGLPDLRSAPRFLYVLVLVTQEPHVFAGTLALGGSYAALWRSRQSA